MAWIRLFDQSAPDGEEMTDTFEISVVPDVGDRVVFHSHEGDVIAYEVLGRTFEVVFDEGGETDGEARATLDVERLELTPDDDDEQEVPPDQDEGGKGA